MNKSILVAGTALMAALSAAGLQAEPIQLAALSNVEGRVLVNKGKGFATAKPGTPLVEGDRVIALDGSRAAVVYKDGCVTHVKENSLLALDKAAGCGKEAVKTGGGQPLRYAQAIGATQTDAGGGSGGGAGNPNRGTATRAAPSTPSRSRRTGAHSSLRRLRRRSRTAFRIGSRR